MNAPILVITSIDPRSAFLGRAAARDCLYRAGTIDLDEAFGELIGPFMAIVGVCELCGNEAPCRNCSDADLRRSHVPPKPRPTPAATIEAILYSVRQRGSGALREPANVARLRSCDEAAKAEINTRIAKYGAAR